MSAAETERRTRDKLVREFGPLVMEALEDPAVTEICLNDDGKLWIERVGQGMTRAGSMDATRAEMALTTVASVLHRELTRRSPSVEGELPLEGNPRIAGSIPPKTLAPQWTIRKPALQVFSLADYARQGALEEPQRAYLASAVRARRSIVIAGNTGSGKTTFANALIREMSVGCPGERVLILEDTREIQCQSANVVRFRTSEAETMQDLVKSALRHRPDRIIVGEVRDGAALALLEAWNTGHEGGIATIHARDTSAAGSLLRLEYLCQKAQLGDHAALIGEAVDLIVTMERRADGVRRVSTITEVQYDRDSRRFITHPFHAHNLTVIKGA